MIARWLIAAALVLSPHMRAGAAEDELPIGQREPLLRVEGNGPTSSVTALAFSPDGQKLYAAGYDKVVRVWALDKLTGRFVLDRVNYRVLVGPGLAGAINCIGLSSDGGWLALGGLGVIRGGADFRSPGFVFPQVGALTDEMREDQGMIYVYKTDGKGNKPPETYLLRGHRGPILALRFVPSQKGRLLLVSAALEWSEKASAFAGVLRLWDVRKGVCLATLNRGLPNQNVQPGLAVWPTGDKPDQLRVAVAWGDGSLRLWDVERGDKGLLSITDGRYNGSLAYLPGAKQPLLTTSFRGPQGEVKKFHGRIQAWKVPEDFEKPSEGLARAFLPRPLGEAGKLIHFLPKALVPLSAQGKGKLDHAAILFRLSPAGQKDRLQLIDLDSDPEQFGQVKAELPLWLPGDSAPVLAAAPNGRHLAVAGNKDHEIVIYSIPDLLNNKTRAQTLQSVGVTMSEVAFVKKGMAAGLRMREVAGNGQKKPSTIFDFSKRNLTGDLEGWKKAGPNTRSWAVDVQTRIKADGKQWQQVVVSHLDNPTGQPIQIKPTQRVTSYALLPTMKPLRTPLLALAYLDFESGEAALALYDVATGFRVRNLSGHVDPIRALAFSGDGKLLASAAEDQTVCLWSLANLDKLVNQRGMLPDLAVAQAEDGLGGVVVKEVKRGSPAFGKLVPGDLIQGLVLADDKLQPLDSPRKFYETMWQKKPGDTVTLRVKDKEAVAIKVGQGIDERNPLFSLFVTRAAQAGDQEWIGWSPLGFYDASAPVAERHLVWHFNKGKRDEPTSTALTGQFRQEYWRQGLLKHLIARADLGAALEDLKKAEAIEKRPRPNLAMWIDEVGPNPKKRDDQGRVPVRAKKATLKLSIADFPFDEGDIVEWQWESGAWQPLQKRAGSEWTADLSKAPWKRGTNRVRARLRTDGDGPQRFTEELVLSYQPPAPQVKFEGKKQQVVQNPSYTLKAEVVPADDNPEVGVSLSHKHESKEILAEDERSAGLAVEKKLTLKPGRNLISVVARNKGALEGAEVRETASLTIEVIYTKKDAPPRVSLVVESLPSGVKTPVEGGQPIVVNAPRVRLTGTIEAEGNLTVATWQQNDGKRVKLTDFTGAKGKTFAIAEELALKPGLKPTELRFFAKTATSEEAEATVPIAYHPSLPRIALTAPAEGKELFEGEDKPTVKVEGQLTWPDDDHPCKALVLVNGKEVASSILEKKAATLTETAALVPGDNRIQVRLTNEWNKTSTTEAILVRYLRPPRIMFLADKDPLVSKKPLITLEATVDSALPLKSVKTEVNGAIWTGAAKLIPPADKEKGTLWKVQLKDISLNRGKNDIVLWAYNVETRSRKKASLTVDFEPPAELAKRPEVELVNPAKDISVTKRDLTVLARIKSAAPLTSVALLREGGRSPVRVTVDLTGAKPNPQGFYEVAANIKLLPQENVLRVEALNRGGGTRSAPVTVSYTPQRPVRVEIQHLEVKVKGSDIKIQPSPSASGNGLFFDPVPTAKVWVVGQVTWDPESDALLAKDHQIDIYVNGLRQLPVDLEATSGKDRSRTFKAQISLNRAEKNLLQIELPPELKRSADNQPRYLVDCKKPAERQRVYLLPIGVGEKDEQMLLKKIFDVLQAKDIDVERERFRTPAFYEGRLYGPLTGYVNRRQVLTQLNRIKQEMSDQKKIDLRNPADAPSDVLLLYFRGGDSVASGKYELRTSDRQVAITREQLLKEFGATLGAQVLLLDVDRQGSTDDDNGKRIAQWPIDSLVSMFRFVRLDSKNPRKNEPFLIDVLADALSRASKLSEVKFQLEKMRKPNPKVAFDDFYPEPLADLILGNKK